MKFIFNSNKNIWKLYLGCCILFICIMAWPGRFYFLNDDFDHLPAIASGEAFHTQFCRPIAQLSILFDYHMFYKNAFGYHLHNLIIHLLSSFFVFINSSIFIKIILNGNENQSKKLSVIIASFFLLYPFHSESLYWIIGRGGSVAGLFLFVSLYFFLKYVETTKFLLISTVAYILAFFSYESSYIYPAIIFLLLLKIANFNYRKIDVKPIVYFISATIICLMIRFYVLKNIPQGYASMALESFNIKQLLYNLNLLVARSLILPIENYKLMLYMYFLIGLIFMLTLFHFYQKKQAIFLQLFFLISLFIVSLIPVTGLGISSHTFEGGRFLYFPSFFFILFLVFFINQIQKNWIKNFFYVSIIIYFIFLQIKISNLYQYASNITLQTVKAFQISASVNNLNLKNLPTENNGIVIFRSGIQNCLKWMADSFKFRNVNIISTHPFNCIPNSIQIINNLENKNATQIEMEWGCSFIKIQNIKE